MGELRIGIEDLRIAVDVDGDSLVIRIEVDCVYWQTPIATAYLPLDKLVKALAEQAAAQGVK